jgi:hypothetical protein
MLLVFALSIVLMGCRANAQGSRPAAEWRVVADVPLPGKAARL